MSNIIIKVEDLAKSYQISHEKTERYTALRDVIANNVKSFVGSIKGLTQGNASAGQVSETEEFWALNGISFDIEKGDRVGIIGRNGAGKSTLLKILSRITEPTRGSISIKGRVASLLEVGTGFHPELTGRENVYLNGAILGMSRHEIKRKFDEIVAFAEVEKFLDTPVKRYSSGMYVRLAFSVAAHLEPEILIVDEVLAVGDAQFQKKCLGKMEDVSKNEGRTVLFVSHSMPTVTSLCNKGILLQSGKIAKMGSVSDVIMNYYSSGVSSPTYTNYVGEQKRPGDEFVKLNEASIRINNAIAESEIDIRQGFTVEFNFEIIKKSQLDLIFNTAIELITAEGVCIFSNHSPGHLGVSDVGFYQAQVTINGNFLNDGVYFVNIGINSLNSGIRIHLFESNILSFNIKDPIEGVPTRNKNYSGNIVGVVRPLLEWKFKHISKL